MEEQCTSKESNVASLITLFNNLRGLSADT